jgi:hypothetical protein
MLRSIGMLLVCLCGSALLAGCRVPEIRLPETGATLEGTIQYGGEAVSIALVIVASDTASATGYVETDGRYKVENVPLGEVKIGVNTEAARGQYISQAMAQSYKGPGGKAKGAAPKFVSVPQKYWEPDTSGISTTTKKGLNTFDIVLTK